MGAGWQLFTFRLDLHGTECPLVQSVTTFIVTSELSVDHLLMQVSHRPDPASPLPATRPQEQHIWHLHWHSSDSGHWLMTLNTYYTSHILAHTHCNVSFYNFPQTITSTKYQRSMLSVPGIFYVTFSSYPPSIQQLRLVRQFFLEINWSERCAHHTLEILSGW